MKLPAEGLGFERHHFAPGLRPRALAGRVTVGLTKLTADRGSDRLMGAHVMAAEAGETIHSTVPTLRSGLLHAFTVADLREMFFPDWVQAERLKLAAQTSERDVAQLSCCAG